MNINDHIAAIKEHLKAIENKPKRYLVIPIGSEDFPFDAVRRLSAKSDGLTERICHFLGTGKIITINEE